MVTSTHVDPMYHKGRSSVIDDIVKQREDIHDITPINGRSGRGTFGQVYTGILRKKNRNYNIAIKSYIMHCNIDHIRELTALRRFKHKNVIKLIEIIATGNTHAPVMMSMQYNLSIFMKNNKDVCTNNANIILEQITSGVCYCHSLQFMHRDLKPANILVNFTTKIVVRICDFGQSKMYIPEKNYTLECGTLWYRPLDLLLGNEKYSYDIDIWAIGCIYMELVTGMPFISGDCEWDMIRKFIELFSPIEEYWPDIIYAKEYVAHGGFPRFKTQAPVIIPPEIRDFLNIDSSKRISTRTLQKIHTIKYDKTQNTHVTSNIFENQTELNKKMRQILVDWIFELAFIEEFEDHTLHVAFNILDKVLASTFQVSKKDFQLVGVVVLMISSKLHEKFPLQDTFCVHICDHSYTLEQVTQMEKKVCSLLDFNFSTCTYIELLKNTQTNQIGYLLANIIILHEPMFDIINTSEKIHIMSICYDKKIIPDKYDEKNKQIRNLCIWYLQSDLISLNKKFKNEIKYIKEWELLYCDTF